MANQTGTFLGSTDLLHKLNTFLVANAWTKLLGEEDIVPASPKAARYWRLLIIDTTSSGANRQSMRKLEWRSVTGGANVATVEANYSFSSIDATASALVAGRTSPPGWDTPVLLGGQWRWVQYDFGSPTIIHEIVIQIDSTDEGPKNFLVQWSHDGQTWMTMDGYENEVWTTAGQSRTFTWDTGSGYTEAYHPSATIGRRSGWLRDISEGDVRNADVEGCLNMWQWQGTGYDADRRVFVNAINFSTPGQGTDTIVFDACVESDLTGSRITFLDDQPGSSWGANGFSPCLVVNSDTGTYWFYLNATRVFIVTKAGLEDYSCAYIGFLAAFALPDDHPFPLYVGATHYDRTITLSDTNSGARDAVDPGNQSAYVRLWDNTWREIANHDETQGLINDPVQIPLGWTWPFHVGSSARDAWPQITVGDYADYDAHFLDRMQATLQGDLPLWPVSVWIRQTGVAGALDGVFCVPSGGVLSAESVITIAAVDYRVFRVRAKAGGMCFWAVRED